MSPGVHTEFAFEERVEYELLRRGWDTSDRACMTRSLGFATAELWEFVGKTQVKKFDKLIELHGGDQATAMRAFAIRVANEVDARGVLGCAAAWGEGPGGACRPLLLPAGAYACRRCAQGVRRECAVGGAAAAFLGSGCGAVGRSGVFRERAAGGIGRAEEPDDRAGCR